MWKIQVFMKLFSVVDVSSRMWFSTVAPLLPLQWRHNGRGGVSNHQPHDCLPNRLFRRRSKKTSKLRVTGLCVNSPYKWPVTRKMFPFDYVIMCSQYSNDVKRFLAYYIYWQLISIAEYVYITVILNGLSLITLHLFCKGRVAILKYLGSNKGNVLLVLVMICSNMILHGTRYMAYICGGCEVAEFTPIFRSRGQNVGYPRDYWRQWPPY